MKHWQIRFCSVIMALVANNALNAATPDPNRNDNLAPLFALSVRGKLKIAAEDTFVAARAHRLLELLVGHGRLSSLSACSWRSESSILDTHLLWLHSPITVHALYLAVHRLLSLSIGGRGAWLYLARVHVGVLAVILIGPKSMASKTVISCRHGMRGGRMVRWLWHAMLAWHLGVCLGWDALGCGSSLSRCSLCVRRSLLARNYVNKKIKHVRFGEGRRNVRSL